MLKPIKPEILTSKVAVFIDLFKKTAEVELQAAQLAAVNAVKKSEQRFRSLSTCSPVGIFLIDIAGNCTYTNPLFQSICGSKLEANFTEGWLQSVHPEDRTQVLVDWNVWTKGDREYSKEFRLLTQAGIVRWVNVRSSPMLSDQGELNGYVGTVEDITERKRAEEALQQSEERFRLLVENVKDYAIFMINTDGRITSWNAGVERIFGYHESEIIGQHFSCIFTLADIQSGQPEQELSTAVAKGRADDERWHLCKNGTTFWASGVVTAFRDDAGNLRGFIKVVRDITERKQTEEALQKAKEELEIRVENRTTELKNANDCLQSEIIERQQTEKALLESQIRLKLINNISTAGITLGMSVEQIIEHTIKQISEYFQTFRVTYSTIDNQGKFAVINSIEPQGISGTKELVLDLTIAPEYAISLCMKECVIVEEVTQDVRLKPLASKFLANGIQALLNVPFQHPNSLVGLLSFESSQSRKWREHEIATLVGIAQYLSILVKNAHAQHQRRRAELELRTSEERYRQLVELSPYTIFIQFDGKFALINSAGAKLLGVVKPKELVGKSVLDFVHPDYQKIFTSRIQQIKEETRDIALIEEKWIRSDGTVVDVEVAAIPFSYEGKLAIQVVVHDITGRKQAAEQIKVSLKEKEVLLREVNHRVKNNLQIISSLLSLQSGYVNDQQTIEVLQHCESRVMSMALIHEQLYQSKDFARIDFAEYVENLVTNLFSSYDVSSEAITLKLDVDNIFLSVDIAIPCGLIINELVLNSLKHAFIIGQKGEVCIELCANDDNCLTLSISDNGIGFPKNLDFQNTESLGLQIVVALTSQLEGTIELIRNIGTKFKIKF